MADTHHSTRSGLRWAIRDPRRRSINTCAKSRSKRAARHSLSVMPSSPWATQLAEQLKREATAELDEVRVRMDDQRAAEERARAELEAQPG